MMTTKVLIIRFSSIGDIVLTTPVVRCLKQQLDGDVEIHYLTKTKYADILIENPHLTAVHTIQSSVNEVINQLEAIDFDYIIDLHRNIRSARVKSKLKGLAFTFDKLNIQKWVMVNFKKNLLPNVHIVDRYLDTVKHLGVVNDNKGLDYFIPKKDEVDISIFPESHQNGYVGLVIGGSYFTKKLPPEMLLEICNRCELPIILLGGNEDKEVATYLAKEAGNNVYNACGMYSLHQSASIVRQAQRIITHDTGLMHIAAAFKKEIISVWGNTIPEFGMYPYLPNDKSRIVENKHLKCRPCSKLGFDKCPKGHFKCIKMLSIEEIIG